MQYRLKFVPGSGKDPDSALIVHCEGDTEAGSLESLGELLRRISWASADRELVLIGEWQDRPELSAWPYFAIDCNGPDALAIDNPREAARELLWGAADLLQQPAPTPEDHSFCFALAGELVKEEVAAVA